MKILDWFESLIRGAVNGITAPITEGFDKIGDMIKDGMINTLLGSNPGGTDLLKDSLGKLLDNPDLPPELRPILKEWTSHTPPLIAACAPLVAALVAYPAVSAAFSPMLQELTQEVNAKIRPSVLTPGEIITARWRGKIDQPFANQEFAWLGYDETRQKVLEDITTFYPSPQDFITFAVRDTFNKDVVKRYKYDDNYPTDINQYVAKSGMSPDWLLHYWRAHWQLPSPTQMYEMLHRGKITMEDAETLLKTADYAPYFIKPMLDISYNTYTRVDVRRMYNEGVLTRDEVKAAYLEIGYDEIKAEKLTDWTTKESMGRERDLTLSQIIEAYKDGALTDTDAIKQLIGLGYDDNESKLVLKLEDDKIERAFTKREKAILVKKFVKDRLTLEEMTAGLNALALSQRELALTIEEAKLQVKETETPA